MKAHECLSGNARDDFVSARMAGLVSLSAALLIHGPGHLDQFIATAHSGLVRKASSRVCRLPG
jgi:hypothetical protein